MNCLCARTRRAARFLTRVYEQELRPADLTVPQFELLSTLRGHPGMAQAGVAEALDLNQTTLSRNLKLLLAKKWIERTANARDRRQALYTVTAAGEQAWLYAAPYWDRAQKQVQQTLGTDWLTVRTAIDRLLLLAGQKGN